MVIHEYAFFHCAFSRINKHPQDSMTSNEEERNQYIVANYKRRLDYMIQNNQVYATTVFSIDRS